jgi:hypothetical protein
MGGAPYCSIAINNISADYGLLRVTSSDVSPIIDVIFIYRTEHQGE